MSEKAMFQSLPFENFNVKGGDFWRFISCRYIVRLVQAANGPPRPHRRIDGGPEHAVHWGRTRVNPFPLPVNGVGRPPRRRGRRGAVEGAPVGPW